MSDRYLKAVLTVIAFELLWLGVKDIGIPVSAQATKTPPAAQAPAAPAPMAVVIRGVEIQGQPPGMMPVISPLPLNVSITGPVTIDATEPIPVVAGVPLKVEADRPLPVQSVPYTPADKPGE